MPHTVPPSASQPHVPTDQDRLAASMGRRHSVGSIALLTEGGSAPAGLPFALPQSTGEEPRRVDRPVRLSLCTLGALAHTPEDDRAHPTPHRTLAFTPSGTAR